MKTLEESTAKSTRRNFLKIAGSAAVFYAQNAESSAAQPTDTDLPAKDAKISEGKNTMKKNTNVLWYKQPANQWMQSLPVGNGRLGAMVSGGIEKEVIFLDEESIWSGCPTDNNRPGASEYIDQVRQLIFTGQYDKARTLAQEKLTGYDKNYGTHLRAGGLVIDFEHAAKDTSSYRRELDMASGVSKVSYENGGLRYQREIFATYVDNVIVMKISADRAGAVNFTLILESDRDDVVVTKSPKGLVLRAGCPEGGG